MCIRDRQGPVPGSVSSGSASSQPAAPPQPAQPPAPRQPSAVPSADQLVADLPAQAPDPQAAASLALTRQP
eukprot:1032185-Alexandrium_andersonii.AAC.1